jgi:hypothetical protein
MLDLSWPAEKLNTQSPPLGLPRALEVRDNEVGAGHDWRNLGERVVVPLAVEHGLSVAAEERVSQEGDASPHADRVIEQPSSRKSRARRR